MQTRKPSKEASMLLSSHTFFSFLVKLEQKNSATFLGIMCSMHGKTRAFHIKTTRTPSHLFYYVPATRLNM